MEGRNGSPVQPFEGNFQSPLNMLGLSSHSMTNSVTAGSPIASTHRKPSSSMPWRNRDAGAVVSTVVEDGVTPGRIGDALPAARYQGRVLDPDSEEAQRTNQRVARYVPGLLGRRKRQGRGANEEEDEEEMHREGLQRVVVDGVEELQHVTTGLLARHLGEELNVAPSTLATQSVHYLATDPQYTAQSRAGGGSSGRPGSNGGSPSPPPPVDDRVTPQALHLLLRKGQKQAAHKLTQGRLNGRYYTFTAGPGAKEAAAAALEMAEAKSKAKSASARFAAAVGDVDATAPNGGRAALPHIGAGAAGKRTTARSKHTVKGETPQDFVRATNTATAAEGNPLVSSGPPPAQLEYLRAQLTRSGITGADGKGNTGKSVLAANIAYLEPPSITTAHQALYQTAPDARVVGADVLARTDVNRTGPVRPGTILARADGDGDEGTGGVTAESDKRPSGVAVTTEAPPHGGSRSFVPYASPELDRNPPASLAAAAMTYPPPPVVYASAEDAKRAADRHRLRPIKLRTKAELEALSASRAATGTIPKAVRDALISTTGGVGRSAGAGGTATSAARDADDGDDTDANNDAAGLYGDEDADPFREDAKKYGVEMDVEGVKDGLALDFAFSAALRGDDRQLVEQLAQQYGEQCLRRQLEARRQAQQRRLRALKLTGRVPPALGALTEKNVQARGAQGLGSPNTTADGAGAPVSVEEPPFSVLESVLAVSREFEKIKPYLLAAVVEGQPRDAEKSAAANTNTFSSSSSARFLAGAAVPLESSVLARDRRAVVDRLTSFESSRIPGRFWITLQERGAGAASRHANTMTGRTGASGGGGGTVSASSAEASLGGYARNRVAIMSDFAGTGSASERNPSLATRASIRTTGGAAGTEIPASVVAVSHQPKDGSQLTVNQRQDGDERGGGERGEPSAANVLFPAVRPTGRAQVYLLAETLDHMLLHDSSLLKTVTDPEVAYRILPRVLDDDDGDDDTSDDDDERHAAADRDAAALAEAVDAEWLLAHTKEARHPLLDLPTREAAEDAFRQYTDAADEVLAVVDAGLVEVVRQVSSQCIERGALLDGLRQTLVDLTDSSLHVLVHAKERACEEAVHSLQLRHAWVQERRIRRALQASQASTSAEMAQLRAENERLGEKAAHLDLLIARAEAKRNRFDLEASYTDDHGGLLQALEEEINASAMKAMNDLYDAEADLGTGGVGRSARGKRNEAPSAAEARRRVTEQKATSEQLYQESYALLRAMNQATTAMNEATAPLYNGVALNKVSLNANVAAGRWAEVARAVGAFESEKKHRFHVFQVFSDWCDRYQTVHRIDDDGTSQRGSTDFLVDDVDDDHHDDGDSANRSAGTPRESHGPVVSAAEALMSSSSMLTDTDARRLSGDESPNVSGLVSKKSQADETRSSLRMSTQSARLSLQGRRHRIQDLVKAKIRKQQEDQNQPQPQTRGETGGGGEGDEGGEADEGTQLHQVLQRIQYATTDDLIAMGVDDCSVDEVNAMFARDFDFKAYLYTQWEPHETSHTLQMADIVDMIHDINATMQEMTLRMNALSSSAIVRRGVEPPMQAPARPGDVCALCGRRDGAAEEKRRRQESMRVIAHQVQLRLDQMKEKCQHAEADREVARNESRRLEGELNATLQREQVLRKQLRDTSDQMSVGNGKVVAAGRPGGRNLGSGGGLRSSPKSASSRARSPRSRNGPAAGSPLGSTGRRSSNSTGRVTPTASILTPHNGSSRRASQGSQSPPPPHVGSAGTAANSMTGGTPPILEPGASSTSGAGVSWDSTVPRAPTRRQSVVGVFAPNEPAGSSPTTTTAAATASAEDSANDSNSPPRRCTLPPSATSLDSLKMDSSDDDETS